MGCCSSRPAADDDDRPPSAPGHPPRSTPRAVNSTSPIVSSGVGSQFPALQQPPSLASRSNLSNSRHSSTQRGLPLHEHYNTPLELPLPWRSTDRTWTHAQLDRERAEFFETRVTGRPEIWGALKNVCELLREGELATAQGILEAAGITMPTGALTDGCYDEAGNLYRLPEVILLDPINVLPDETVGEMGLDRPTSNIDGETMVGPGEMKTASVKSGEVDEAEKEEDAEARERRREEKGKGIERDAVKVKCRLSDRGGPDVVVFLGKTQTVGTLARRVKSDADIGSDFRIRIAYLGKILNDKETLIAQGWKEGHVVNALVASPLPDPRSG